MDEQEQTIDLRNLLIIIKEHIVVILAATIVCGAIGFLLSEFIIEKKYTSEALLYVENSASKSDDSTININDINAAQKLVNTCEILFKSNYMLELLSESLPQYDYTSAKYAKMITIESVNGTEVLKISVETNSPKISVEIANKLVELSKIEYMRVIKNGLIEVVSNAIYPKSHVFPNNKLFVVSGFAIGFLGAYFVFLIIETFDTKVKPDDDLAKKYDIPVFAEIMDFLTVDKLDYKYSDYNSKHSGLKKGMENDEKVNGTGLDFDDEADDDTEEDF